MINSLTENNVFPESTEILKDVADTPISPELLPPEAKEGMCLQLNIEVDDGATEARAAEIRKIFDQFF